MPLDVQQFDGRLEGPSIRAGAADVAHDRLPPTVNATTLSLDVDGFNISAKMNMRDGPFEFKTGSDVFTPYDLVELPRPGKGVANAPGDLVFVQVNTYSLENKK